MLQHVQARGSQNPGPLLRRISLKMGLARAKFFSNRSRQQEYRSEIQLKQGTPIRNGDEKPAFRGHQGSHLAKNRDGVLKMLEDIETNDERKSLATHLQKCSLANPGR